MFSEKGKGFLEGEEGNSSGNIYTKEEVKKEIKKEGLKFEIKFYFARLKGGNWLCMLSY